MEILVITVKRIRHHNQIRLGLYYNYNKPLIEKVRQLTSSQYLTLAKIEESSLFIILSNASMGIYLQRNNESGTHYIWFKPFSFCSHLNR